jgi:hypothetical protein
MSCQLCVDHLPIADKYQFDIGLVLTQSFNSPSYLNPWGVIRAHRIKDDAHGDYLTQYRRQDQI